MPLATDKRETLVAEAASSASRAARGGARAARASSGGSSLQAAIGAAILAQLLKPGIARNRKGIIVPGLSRLQSFVGAQVPKPVVPPTPSFGLEAWLATAAAYWDAEDASKRTMSGSDLVTVASKGTLGALLAKITSGSAQIGSLGGAQAFENLSSAFTLSVRDAGDTADVDMSDIAPVAASCFVFVVGRVDGIAMLLGSDVSAWIGHNISAAGVPSATYWPAGPETATWGSSISHTDPHVIAIKHGGGNLSISVDGGTFVDEPCGNVGGTSAARIIGGLRGRVSKMAVWGVRDPANFDAGIAALKTYYSIP